MEIIKKGQVPTPKPEKEQVFKAKCPNCGCIIRFRENEADEAWRDLGGHPGSTHSLFVNCPTCKSPIWNCNWEKCK